jgi:hypothetical protein
MKNIVIQVSRFSWKNLMRKLKMILHRRHS